MSKEFIPGLGLTSPSAHTRSIPQTHEIDDNADTSLISPSMEQFKHRDPKNIPYWSPATKLSYTDTVTNNDEDGTQSNSNLAASAREFVPTFGSSSSSSSSSSLPSELTGMNSAASEWRPPQAQQELAAEHEAPPSPELPEYHTAEQGQPEQLVEVSTLTTLPSLIIHWLTHISRGGPDGTR